MALRGQWEPVEVIMPTFAVVPIEQAQRPPANSKRDLLLKAYQGFIERVGPRQAGSLAPEGDETPQAVRRRLGAAAKLSGVNLTVRRAGQTVYFWKATRRGRPRRSPR